MQIAKSLYTRSILCILVLAATTHMAGAATLIAGDKAPQLKVDKWVHGQPVKTNTEGSDRIQVIDFWTSWCPKCMQLLLDRTAAHQQFAAGKVDFILISNERPDQLLANVGSYIDQVPLSIGCDTNADTLRAYIGDTSDASIPLTVIIDRNGRIAWIDHSNAKFDDRLRQVLDGTWDIARQREKALAQRRFDDLCNEARTAASNNDCTAMLKLGETLLATTVLDDQLPQRAQAMNEMAWILLTEAPCADHHGQDALKFAKQAVDDTQNNNGSIIDTYALALYKTGDRQGAIDNQKHAVELVAGSFQEPQFRETLRKYTGQTEEQKTTTDQQPDTATATPQPKPQKPKSPWPESYPVSVTAAQAKEDLLHLHDYLHLNYAGYDDIAWKLRSEGTDWQSRTDQFAKKIESQEVWPIRKLHDLLRDYLTYVQDSHCLLLGPENEDGTGWHAHWLVKRYRPFFTSIRIAEKNGRKTICNVGDADKNLLGTEVRDIPIASTHTAVMHKPMLFPTIPNKGEDNAYLLGIFTDDEPDKDLQCRFFKPDGTGIDAHLPLHRSKALSQNDGDEAPPAWQIKLPPESAFPTVCVRTLVKSELPEEMVNSAETLRDKPIAVLDLRGNGGGSDSPSINWCSRFSKQTFDWWPAAILNRKITEPYTRWYCELGSHMGLDPKGQEKPQPYKGKLFILVDRRVASSGETFVGLAKQIPGATILGENSAGCVTYGNCDIIESLPNSKLTIRFGWVKFMQSAIMPNEEGIGRMPDYWLDDLDPYEAIKKLTARS